MGRSENNLKNKSNQKSNGNPRQSGGNSQDLTSAAAAAQQSSDPSTTATCVEQGTFHTGQHGYCVYSSAPLDVLEAVPDGKAVLNVLSKCRWPLQTSVTQLKAFDLGECTAATNPSWTNTDSPYDELNNCLTQEYQMLQTHWDKVFMKGIHGIALYTDKNKNKEVVQQKIHEALSLMTIPKEAAETKHFAHLCEADPAAILSALLQYRIYQLSEHCLSLINSGKSIILHLKNHTRYAYEDRFPQQPSLRREFTDDPDLPMALSFEGMCQNQMSRDLHVSGDLHHMVGKLYLQASCMKHNKPANYYLGNAEEYETKGVAFQNKAQKEEAAANEHHKKSVELQNRVKISGMAWQDISHLLEQSCVGLDNLVNAKSLIQEEQRFLEEEQKLMALMAQNTKKRKQAARWADFQRSHTEYHTQATTDTSRQIQNSSAQAANLGNKLGSSFSGLTLTEVNLPGFEDHILAEQRITKDLAQSFEATDYQEVFQGLDLSKEELDSLRYITVEPKKKKFIGDDPTLHKLVMEDRHARSARDALHTEQRRQKFQQILRRQQYWQDTERSKSKDSAINPSKLGIGSWKKAHILHIVGIGAGLNEEQLEFIRDTKETWRALWAGEVI